MESKTRRVIVNEEATARIFISINFYIRCKKKGEHDVIAVEDITEYCWVISFTPINSRIVLIILQNESIFRWAATAVGREVIIACHSGIFGNQK